MWTDMGQRTHYTNGGSGCLQVNETGQLRFDVVAPPARAFIRTNGSRMVNLADPLQCQPERHPFEVAHALANLCRFTGHCKQFYSVAQHAVNCSTLMLDKTDADPFVQYARLHHDDREAYYGDMSAPLKRLPQMAGYRELERDRADQCAWIASAVKAADDAMGRRELYDLLDYGSADSWVPPITRCWSPIEAEFRWLRRHFKLAVQVGDIDEAPSVFEIARRVIRGRML